MGVAWWVHVNNVVPGVLRPPQTPSTSLQGLRGSGVERKQQPQA